MSSPKLEDGYTQIANEIIDALAAYRIPGEQMQVLFVIIRKTYGFNKREDFISNSQFCKSTGLKKPSVCRAINILIDKNIVSKKDNRKIPNYRFNKNYKSWKVLAKKITVSNIVNAVSKKDNKLLAKKLPTKEKKETIQKKDIYSVFDFWNKQQIIIHRDLIKFESCINAKLDSFTLEEIQEAIKNYKTILGSDEYFMNYKWTIKEFFTRSNGFEKFLNINNPFENYKKFSDNNYNQNNNDDISQQEKDEIYQARKIAGRV